VLCLLAEFGEVLLFDGIGGVEILLILYDDSHSVGSLLHWLLSEQNAAEMM
jgi:chemotaxis receptor (MCP) glutamine deamidase CheD